MDTKSTPQNIQDAFLNSLRRERDTVTIYLVNGAKLSGRIKSFDKFSLILESGINEQLIFKHAISTIMHTRARQTGELNRPPQLSSPSSSAGSAQPSSSSSSSASSTNQPDDHHE